VKKLYIVLWSSTDTVDRFVREVYRLLATVRFTYRLEKRKRVRYKMQQTRVCDSDKNVPQA